MNTSKTSGATGGYGARSTDDGNGSKSPFKSKSVESSLSLGDCSPQALMESLDAVLNTGALISMGRTSDGGAIGVYLTHDGHRYKEWASESEKLEQIFEALREWALSMG